jgi:PAS domain S-box-containing protein
MDESPLDLVRRQIREAEDRQRARPAGQAESASPLSKDARLKSNLDPGSTPKSSMLNSEGGNKELCAALQRNLSTLLNLSNDALIIVDWNGAWELANHHLRNWLGYTEEEFQRINLTEIFEAEEIQRLQGSFPQWLTGEKPIRRAAFTLRSCNGDKVRVLLSTHSCMDKEGKPIAYLVVENMNEVRALLSAWAESTEFLGRPERRCRLMDLVRESVAAHTAELERWQIEPVLYDSEEGMLECSCTSTLLQALLHILQSCIEQLRKSISGGRLTIRVHGLSNRIETTFLCESLANPSGNTGPERAVPSFERLYAQNIHFRAAQRLLDAMGGTLVWENVSATQRLIRMNLSLAALSLNEAVHE